MRYTLAGLLYLVMAIGAAAAQSNEPDNACIRMDIHAIFDDPPTKVKMGGTFPARVGGTHMTTLGSTACRLRYSVLGENSGTYSIELSVVDKFDEVRESATRLAGLRESSSITLTFD